MGTFNICIQALTLVFQVQSSKQAISDRYYRILYESLLDPRLPDASKQPMYLNLLFRSLSNDSSLKRTRAFVKRILQICSYVPTSFACACLFLISEITKQKPGLWGMIDQPEETSEEHFVDVLDEEDMAQIDESQGPEDQAEKEAEQKQPIEKSNKYDGAKREPLYANADQSCLWELVPFASHFHPTVALYAQTLLSRASIEAPSNAVNYDPLQNHTLQRFLDRFVYKNPKQVESLNKGSSVMQPRTVKSDDLLVSGGRKRNVVIVSGEKREMVDDRAVNQYNNENEVPVDEMFFFKYFKGRKSSGKKKTGDDELEDEDLVASDEEWEAIERSAGFPKNVDGESDGLEDDDEADMDAFDQAMAQEDESDGEDPDLDGEGAGEIESDGEMDQMLLGEESFSDEEEGEEEEEEEDATKSAGGVKRKLKKLASKAETLGYKGEFFKGGNVFAVADEFEEIIEKEDSDVPQDEQEPEQPKKRKHRAQKGSGKRRRRN